MTENARAVVVSVSAFSNLNLQALDEPEDPQEIMKCWYRDGLAIGWCCYCRDYHIHGARFGETMSAREAHCGDGLRRIYLLDISLGDVPSEVDLDRRRKRPRGPRGVSR